MEPNADVLAGIDEKKQRSLRVSLVGNHWFNALITPFLDKYICMNTRVNSHGAEKGVGLVPKLLKQVFTQTYFD